MASHLVYPPVSRQLLALAASVMLAAFLPGALAAQYPPSGYPGGYPPGQGPGPSIPFPRGRKAKPAKTKPEEPQLKTWKGTLRSVDSQEIVLETADTRVIKFRRQDVTRFQQDGTNIDPQNLQPGDQISVAASQDENAFFDAVIVTLVKAGTAEDKARAMRPLDEPRDPEESAKQEGGAGETDALGRPRIEPEFVPADRGPGPGEEGPPRLARGIPPKKASPAPAPTARTGTAESAPPPAPAAETGKVVVVDRDGVAAKDPSGDPVLDQARENYSTFVETLPNYEVRQITTRYQSSTRPVDWRALDQVTADVIYMDGKESYQNLKVNNKPVKGKVEDSGSWSTGEFNTTLAALFAPWTRTHFRSRGARTVANRSAVLYEFEVDQPRSQWTIYAGAQAYRPAYRGSLWIDKETFRVLRIEMQATEIPKDFPLDTAESTVDYDFVNIGESKFLLPVHAEALSCVRGAPACSRNKIDFRNYRKFGAESNILFDK